MVSKSQEDRNTALWVELTKSSWETEEDQSAMIPTSSEAEHFKKELTPSKKELLDYTPI